MSYGHHASNDAIATSLSCLCRAHPSMNIPLAKPCRSHMKRGDIILVFNRRVRGGARILDIVFTILPEYLVESRPWHAMFM
jgi:hypothetical protein